METTGVNRLVEKFLDVDVADAFPPENKQEVDDVIALVARLSAQTEAALQNAQVFHPATAMAEEIAERRARWSTRRAEYYGDAK